MRNIQITYRLIALPEKHIYKSEAIRHEKMRVYLQNVLEVKEAFKIYPIIVFFNILGSKNDDSSLSAIPTRGEYGRIQEKALE